MATPLPPLSDDSWPPEAAALRDGFAGKLNVYRVMAHHPALLNAWAGLREHLVRRSALGPERSEIVILRTAHRLGSSYEWLHHVSRARQLGMSDARIRSIAADLREMTPEDALISGAVDELCDRRQLRPETRDAALASLGKEAVLDLIATVGFYSVLGGILMSFETPLDDDIAAEMAARPL